MRILITVTVWLIQCSIYYWHGSKRGCIGIELHYLLWRLLHGWILKHHCHLPRNPIKTIARLDGFLSSENLILVTRAGLAKGPPSLPLPSPPAPHRSATVSAPCFAKTPMNVVIHCHPVGHCSHCSAASAAEAAERMTRRWLVSNHSLNTAAQCARDLVLQI